MSCDDNVDCGRRRLLVATAAAGGRGRGRRSRALRVQHAAFRACQGGRGAGRSGYQQAGSGPDDDRRVARQAGLDHQSHQGAARFPGQDCRQACGSEVRQEDAAGLRKNETRSIKPEILVAVGICTHLGCSPTEKFKTGAESGIDADWAGGFFCPCHGSTFDLAGRVYKSKPAPDNLEIPPHMYLGDAKLVIGEDKKA
jgi:ubiquinol-cytochrome c reductase iron-sulfur subunit